MSASNVAARPADAKFIAAADRAKRMLRQRRERELMLGAAHFADPNWDMMLDLFVSQVAGENVATSSLIISACVSPSTALRRIRRLLRDGDLIARADPHDGRRTYLRLSDDLFDRVGALLARWECVERAEVAGSPHP